MRNVLSRVKQYIKTTEFAYHKGNLWKHLMQRPLDSTRKHWGKQLWNIRQANVLLFRAQGKVVYNSPRPITWCSTAFTIWMIFSSQRHLFSIAFLIFQFKSIYSFSGLGEDGEWLQNYCHRYRIATGESYYIFPLVQDKEHQGLLLLVANSSITWKILLSNQSYFLDFKEWKQTRYKKNKQKKGLIKE